MASLGPALGRRSDHGQPPARRSRPHLRDDPGHLEAGRSRAEGARDGHEGDRDLVRLYLKEIRRTPLLTRADEVRLGTQQREGRRLALHALCRASAMVDEVLYLGAHLPTQAAEILPLLYAAGDGRKDDRKGEAPPAVQVAQSLETLVAAQAVIVREREALSVTPGRAHRQARRAAGDRIATARSQQTRALRRLPLAFALVERVAGRMARQLAAAAGAERELRTLGHQIGLPAAALNRLVPNGDGYHPAQAHPALRAALRQHGASATVQDRLCRLSDVAWSSRRPGETPPVEAREILACVARGIQEARAAIVQANLRLVVAYARGFRGCGLELLDLIQEGTIGLMTAVEKFDPGRGFKLCSYATWWIRQAITRALADKGRLIRVPSHMLEVRSKLAQAIPSLARQVGHDPSSEAIAAYLELPARKIRQCLAIFQPPAELDAPIGDGEARLREYVPDHAEPSPLEHADAGLQRTQVETRLATLPAREADILRQRFGFIDGTRRGLVEIGKGYGLTRERIRQIERDALTRLHRTLAIWHRHATPHELDRPPQGPER